MVAIYIAGFAIFFAVASGVYRALAGQRTNVIIRGFDVVDSHRSRSDLLLENLALRQELSMLLAQHPKPQLQIPEQFPLNAKTKPNANTETVLSGLKKAANETGLRLSDNE